jgi:hypothetical protein
VDSILNQSLKEELYSGHRGSSAHDAVKWRIAPIVEADGKSNTEAAALATCPENASPSLPEDTDKRRGAEENVANSSAHGNLGKAADQVVGVKVDRLPPTLG